MMGRSILTACMVAGASLLLQALPAAAAPPTADMVLQEVDKDDDGTIELAEAQQASAKHFARLDANHDGTISKKEAEVDHVGDEAFAAADTDHDGTVDKAEFAKVMEKVFQAADTNHDGKVTVEELKTPTGDTLLGMMQ